MTDELRVPADPQLEADVLGFLACDGDARWLIGVAAPEDFYEHRLVFEALRALHDLGELHRELVCDEQGARWHWPGLSEFTQVALRRICASARTLGNRAAGVDHLQELTVRRAQMKAAADLFNALGAGDDDAIGQALGQLGGTAA